MNTIELWYYADGSKVVYVGEIRSKKNNQSGKYICENVGELERLLSSCFTSSSQGSLLLEVDEKYHEFIASRGRILPIPTEKDLDFIINYQMHEWQTENRGISGKEISEYEDWLSSNRQRITTLARLCHGLVSINQKILILAYTLILRYKVTRFRGD